MRLLIVCHLFVSSFSLSFPLSLPLARERTCALSVNNKSFALHAEKEIESFCPFCKLIIHYVRASQTKIYGKGKKPFLTKEFSLKGIVQENKTGLDSKIIHSLLCRSHQILQSVVCITRGVATLKIALIFCKRRTGCFNYPRTHILIRDRSWIVNWGMGVEEKQIFSCFILNANLID